MKRIIFSLVLALMVLANGRAAEKPLTVIIDADIGNSTDDLFLLMMAYHYMDEGLIDIKGIVVDRVNAEGNVAPYAALADIMNTYYGHPEIPIATVRDGIRNSNVFIRYYQIVDSISPVTGKPLFDRTDTDFSDNLEGYKLYRKVLSESDDHSVHILVPGFVTSLVELLESGPDEYSPLNGVDLVRQKAAHLYMMATRLGGPAEDGNGVGYNLRFDVPKAMAFNAKWPKEVPVDLSPSSVGDNINYTTDLVLADLSKSELNPIKTVYEVYNCDTGQRMWDFLTLINVVHPEFLHFSPEGQVTFTPVNTSDGAVVDFKESDEYHWRYQTRGDAQWNAMMLDYLRSYNKKCVKGRK